MEMIQPTKHADDIRNVTLEIFSSFAPGGGVLKASLDILVRKRLEEGQRILVAEIKERGISSLSEEKWEYYIPAAYRFFEQVRLGEYQHNLKILAKMIADGTSAHDEPSDVGAIARAARKLEMLPLEHLFALSRCERAFEIYAASEEAAASGRSWICIDSDELKMSFAEIGEEVANSQCGEWLHELASRGLLTTGSRAGMIGGLYYYKNQFYRETIKTVCNLNTGRQQPTA